MLKRDSSGIFSLWVMEVLLYAALVISIWALYGVVDSLSSKKKHFTGTIIDKLYKPDASSTGIGHGVTSSGGMATTVISNHSPERWFVMVDIGNGEIEKVYCSDDFFYKKTTTTGSKIEFSANIGGISKKIISDYRVIE